MQAAFRPGQVEVAGRVSDYARISDEEDRKEHVFHFCPDCGSTVFYREPDVVVIMVGSFADPSFPPPMESGYDSRRHQWLTLPDSIQRNAPELWEPARPLYDAGRYADRRRTRAARCSGPIPEWRISTTTSRAARASRAVRTRPSSTYAEAIDSWPDCREMAKQDSDFDPIRAERAFAELIAA